MASTTCGGIITECSNTDEWIAMLEQSIKQDKLAVTIFFAGWSASSKVMHDMLEQLLKTHSEVMFLKVDVDVTKDVSLRLGVRMVPTTLLIRKGKEVERLKSSVCSDFLEQKIILHSQK